MTFKTLRDIERERKEQDMKRIGNLALANVNQFMNQAFPKKKRRKFKIWGFIGKGICILFLLTFILGCASLLKVIIKYLFIGG